MTKLSLAASFISEIDEFTVGILAASSLYCWNSCRRSALASFTSESVVSNTFHEKIIFGGFNHI